MKWKHLIFFLILISCTKYYRIEDLKVDDTPKAYIFGTYFFEKKFVYLPSRLGISIKKDGKIINYFLFSDNEGFFLLPLEEGKYNFVSLNLYSQYTYESYDSQLLNFSLDITEKNKIYYIGNLILNLSFDVEYIYWGISGLSNNFEKDKLLLVTNNTLEKYNFTNIILSKFGKIKKLKYSPASPSNF